MVLLRKQMPIIDDAFHRILQDGLASWDVVLAGLQGLIFRQRRLSSTSVRAFANHALQDIPIDSEELSVVVELSMDEFLHDDLIRMVTPLARQPRTDGDRIDRIWRLYHLVELIEKVPADGVHGYKMINRFWNDWYSMGPVSEEMALVMRWLVEISRISDGEMVRLIYVNRRWIAHEMEALKYGIAPSDTGV